MKDSIDELQDKMEDLEDSIETLKQEHQQDGPAEDVGGQDDITDRGRPDGGPRERQERSTDRRSDAERSSDDISDNEASMGLDEPSSSGEDVDTVSDSPEASDISYSFDHDGGSDDPVGTRSGTGDDSGQEHGGRNQAMKGPERDTSPVGGQDRGPTAADPSTGSDPAGSGPGTPQDRSTGGGSPGPEGAEDQDGSSPGPDVPGFGGTGGNDTGQQPADTTDTGNDGTDRGPAGTDDAQTGSGGPGQQPAQQDPDRPAGAGRGQQPQQDRSRQDTDGSGPGTGRAPGPGGGPSGGEEARLRQSGEGDARDVPAPEEIAPPEDELDPDAGSPEQADGDHPSQEERFREKVRHGLDSVEHGDREEAERLYRSLMLDFRSLKSQGRMSEKDQELLQQLYSKLHRAKRPVRDDD